MSRKDSYSKRFQGADNFSDFENRYDMSSPLIQDLAQRDIKPFHKFTLDLTVAQPITNPFEINLPGRGFVLFGVTSDTISGIKSVSSTALVNVNLNRRSNSSDISGQWTAKHNRGYRGDFERLFLDWPAQSGVNAEFYVFRFDEVPYMSGEAAT